MGSFVRRSTSQAVKISAAMQSMLSSGMTDSTEARNGWSASFDRFDIDWALQRDFLRSNVAYIVQKSSTPSTSHSRLRAH
jgi:hypothetical protein